MSTPSPLTLRRLEALEATVLSQVGGHARTAELMRGLIRHAHAFVRETRPTHDEWMAGVAFLIRVGQTCDEHRNECLLLSDMLGLTSAVDDVNFPGVEGATPSSVEGPFHAVAPPRANGDWISHGPERARGDVMVVRGVVADITGAPLAGASVDVWQANDTGYYDIQDPEQEIGNLRGEFTTDEQGCYWFRTVVPSSYPVPTDGPVGGLLAAIGRHPMRPAHIHVRVTATGYRPVTTHVFIAGDPYLASDAAFAVKDELVFMPERITDAAAAAASQVEAPFFQIEFPVRLVAQSPGDSQRESKRAPVNG